tara:strand:+ start:2627 stop:3103 length:477 start_codon:yes stop_codon:yes gene_type:complete
MSKLTIEKDIEYIKIQVNYLVAFQQKINNAFGDLKSYSTYWSGPKQEEHVYIEIDRWLKCYTQLRQHLSDKEVIDSEIRSDLKELPALGFKKPTKSEIDIAAKSGFTKFMYKAVPPYRISFNKKKVKEIEIQIKDYKVWVEKIRKLSFQIENVYTDGI